MTGTPTSDRVSKEALDQHRQIHFFLERLERAVEQLDESGVDRDPLSRLPMVIDSLRERLEEHNRGEDDGGLLQNVVDVIPEAEDAVLALVEQHERFARALHDARVRAASADDADVPALRDDLIELVRALREHERAEETLLERALATDSEATD